MRGFAIGEVLLTSEAFIDFVFSGLRRRVHLEHNEVLASQRESDIKMQCNIVWVMEDVKINEQTGT